jgi:hypothetical protein
MSEWQPFGYEGKPGTCFWCGRKLAYKSWANWETVETGEIVPADPSHGEPAHPGLVTRPTGERTRADKAGGYQDDSFCGLRCGYQFGLQLAAQGKRLESYLTTFRP